MGTLSARHNVIARLSAALESLSAVVATVRHMSSAQSGSGSRTRVSTGQRRAFARQVKAIRHERRNDPPGSLAGLGNVLCGTRSSRFVVVVASELEAATVDLLEQLGYAVIAKVSHNGTSLLRATWGGAGYGREFTDQPRDLATALRTAGIEARVVDGPVVGTEPLHEWRLIASDPKNADELSLWLVSIGRATGRIAASTAHAAYDHVLSEWGSPPRPWLLVPVQAPGKPSGRASTKRRGVTSEQIRIGLVAFGAVIGAGIALRQQWVLPRAGVGVEPAAQGSASFDWQLFAAVQLLASALVASVLLLMWLASRPLVPKTAWAALVPPKTGWKSRLEKALFCPAGLLMGGTIGAYLTAAFNSMPLQFGIAIALLAVVMLVIGTVDPRDRPAVRISSGALAAILLGFGWLTLPDGLAAAGLGLPSGVVQLDGLTRGVVLGLVLTCPLCLALIGALAFRSWRRRSHLSAALLAIVVFGAVGISAWAGVLFAMTQADALRRDPHAGMYAPAVALVQVQRVPDASTASATRRLADDQPAPSGALYAVVGRVGSHLVVITDPCSTKSTSATSPAPNRIVRLIPAGGLQLEPRSWSTCHQS